eukprot:g15517.t1
MMSSTRPGQSDWTQRMIYDMSYFIIFGVIVLNTVVGLIVDSFGALRLDMEARENDQQTQTFISCIDRRDVEQVAQSHGIADGFEFHETYRQNKWDYMAFIFHLCEAQLEDHPDRSWTKVMPSGFPLGNRSSWKAPLRAERAEDRFMRIQEQTNYLASFVEANQDSWKSISRSMSQLSSAIRDRTGGAKGLLPNPPWSDGVLRRQAQCLSFSVGFLLFCRPSHLCSHRRGNPRYRHRARASSKPVELAQDLDAQDPEMAEASYSSGAFSLTSTLWPPKQVITDIGKLTPIQAEASVGRYTGAAPPLPEWPFYESQMSLEELQALDAKDEEMLKRLTFVDFADQLTRAYDDAPEDEAPRKTRLPAASPETFAAFLRSVEAGETIAAEFAAVAPVERETFVEGLVSSQGSALAMWTQEPESGLAEVHFCIGHDCLKEGPEVEDLLMRLVARKAQAQGAQRLRARARFTEKGKLLVPCPKLQFQLAPGEREFAEDASDAEAMSNRDFTKPKDERRRGVEGKNRAGVAQRWFDDPRCECCKDGNGVPLSSLYKTEIHKNCFGGGGTEEIGWRLVDVLAQTSDGTLTVEPMAQRRVCASHRCRGSITTFWDAVHDCAASGYWKVVGLAFATAKSQCHQLDQQPQEEGQWLARIRATFHGVDTNDDAALLNLERVAERSALEAGTLTALEIPTEVKRVK